VEIHAASIVLRVSRSEVCDRVFLTIVIAIKPRGALKMTAKAWPSCAADALARAEEVIE
jgi:hypothetical protein